MADLDAISEQVTANLEALKRAPLMEQNLHSTVAICNMLAAVLKELHELRQDLAARSGT